MPKISAPTVAEHRARQRSALIHAAIKTLIEDGADAVTPAAVTARSGLSRPSFYLYFPSSAALLAAIVEESFTAADESIADALRNVSSPSGRIDAFVRAELLLARHGVHRVAGALGRAELPAECRQRVVELHQRHLDPLFDALADLEVPQPRLTGELLAGLLQAGQRLVEGGHPYEEVLDRTLHLVRNSLPRQEPAFNAPE
jgi:AcrR family transcriptional regulator